MGIESKYSWDDDQGGQRDPWGALRPSYAENGTLGAPGWNRQTHPSWDPATGMGTPESGYGPGGVTNPAYTGIGSPSYIDPNATARGQQPDGPSGGGPTGPANSPRSTPAGPKPGPQNGDFQSWFMSLTNGKPPTPASLQAMEAELGQYGIKVLRNGRGWADKIQLPDGRAFDVIEAATATGGKRWQWLDDSAGGGGGGVDGTARRLMSSLTGDGHDVKSVGYDRLMIDGRPYKIKDAPTSPAWTPTFGPGVAPYTPGEITFDDLQGLGYQDVATRLNTPVSRASSDLVMSILKNPESLSDLMVDTLKAKNADELAGVATAQDEDLRRFGFANGLEDSNWLASERLGMKRGRDQALIAGNRDIDITAAQTRLADRQAAAQLGTAYQAEERQREALANDTALRTAAATQDRLSLREAVKQKAAELQLDADELMQQYVVAQMEDLTRRWGIEVQADIDLTRLSVQSQQFKEDLIFKMQELSDRMGLGYAQLDQDDRQFGASHGLDLADFELRANEAKRKGSL